MRFAYTYQGKDGARHEGELEANSRGAAFAILKKMGVVPLSLREGGMTGRGRRAGVRPSLIVGGMLLLLLACGGGWWWTAKPPVAVPRPASMAPEVVRVPPKAEQARPATGRSLQSPKATSGVCSAVGVLEPPAPARTGHEEIGAASTSSTELVRRAYDSDDPDAVHITRVNQELGSLFSSQPGEQVIPFPFAFQGDGENPGADYDNMNDGFLKSLKNPIVANEGDSPEKMEWKRNILEARLSLIDGIRNGISVKDSIRDEYAFRVRAYEARKLYILDLQDYAATSPEVTAFNGALKAVNEKLAEQGIKAISADDVGVDPDVAATEKEQDE